MDTSEIVLKLIEDNCELKLKLDKLENDQRDSQATIQKLENEILARILLADGEDFDKEHLEEVKATDDKPAAAALEQHDLQLQRVQREKSYIQARYNETETARSREHLRNEELQKRIEELQDRNEELQNENVELQNRNEEVQNENVELWNRNEELQNKNGELRNRNAELQNRNGELQNRNEEPQNENVELQNRNEELQNENVELQNKVENLDDMRNTIRTLHAEQKRLIESVQEKGLVIRELAGEILDQSESSAELDTVGESNRIEDTDEDRRRDTLRMPHAENSENQQLIEFFQERGLVIKEVAGEILDKAESASELATVRNRIFGRDND